MEIINAVYLAKSSSGHKYSVEDLMLMHYFGRSAYRSPNGLDESNRECTFRMDRMKKCVKVVTSHLYESPEKIAEKYPRADYTFKLFMGDEHGCFVSGTASTHGALLKDTITSGKVRVGGYRVVSQEGAIGHPLKMAHKYAGTILPKQNGVDGTYISFWTKSAYESLLPLFKPLLRTYGQGPYFVEYSTLEDDVDGADFVVEPLNL